MAAVGYEINTEGAVTLVTATAKTILGAKAHANSGLQLKGIDVTFLGVTASAIPVLIELMYSTWATNSPGTNSTSVTVRQAYGRSLTAGFTGGRNWTSEPTTLTQIREWTVSPNAGVFVYDYLPGQEPDCALAEGFVLRLNAPAGVDVRANMRLERI